MSCARILKNYVWLSQNFWLKSGQSSQKWSGCVSWVYKWRKPFGCKNVVDVDRKWKWWCPLAYMFRLELLLLMYHTLDHWNICKWGSYKNVKSKKIMIMTCSHIGPSQILHGREGRTPFQMRWFERLTSGFTELRIRWRSGRKGQLWPSSSLNPYWDVQIKDFEFPSINFVIINQWVLHVSLCNTTILTSNSTIDYSRIAWSHFIPLISRWSRGRWDNRRCRIIVASVIIAWTSARTFRLNI